MTRNQKIDAARNTVRVALYWTAAGLTFAYTQGWWRWLMGGLAVVMGIGSLDALWDALKTPEPEAVRLLKARTVPQQRSGGGR